MTPTPSPGSWPISICPMPIPATSRFHRCPLLPAFPRRGAVIVDPPLPWRCCAGEGFRARIGNSWRNRRGDHPDRLSPFYEIAELLYPAAAVAERYAAVAGLIVEPEALHPTTRAVIEKARQFSAADAFRHQYRLAEIRRDVTALLAAVDLVCVPSIPRFVTLAEIAEDPIAPNSELGTYTNFVNLLDMCGIAVPIGPARMAAPAASRCWRPPAKMP